MNHPLPLSRPLRLLLACAVAALLASCAEAPSLPLTPRAAAPSDLAPGLRLQPAAFDQLPGWESDRFDGVWGAWREDCRSPLPQLRAACAAARSIADDDVAAQRDFFRRWFRPWQALAPDGAERGLVTGYYEPMLDGARTRVWPYLVPLYGPPPADLAGLSRAQLDNPEAQRRLRRHAVAWVRDPVDALFLQIQGSGLLRLDDGRVLRLSYAGNNGWPFRSVARWLLDRGELHGDASMQAIKAWARAHPQQVPAMLDADPRVVYFRAAVLPGQASGPHGALGVPLTALRSVAVDRQQLRLGLPLWLDTRTDTGPLRQLVFAQDVGNAIRGPLRADLFFGSGSAAGEHAGRMKSGGRFWVLLPR